MNRTERNEYNYIRRTVKDIIRSASVRGVTLTIRTDGSAEYKQALDALYTAAGFHPCSICIDSRMFDDNERIHYISNTDAEWREAYTAGERAAFRAALQ